MSQPDLQAVPTLQQIRAAAGRIAPLARRTPVLTSTGLDQMSGARLFFKCENFQRTGSFKIRGASNAVFSLTTEQANHGVITHSSGNHASALACAARHRGIHATIVIPDTAPRAKREMVTAFGGIIHLCEPTMESRQATVDAIRAQTGATLVHSYNDPAIIAGQGTATLELLEELSDLNVVIAPVSGGGLLSGTAIVAKSLRPSIEVFGAEPAQADDASRSFQSGHIEPLLSSDTIADGLRASLCPLTFSIIRRHIRDILTVSEFQIADAMKLVWRYLKVVIEPSGAVPFAAVLAHRERLAGRRIGVLLSGGNLDLERLPWQA
jgi:threonine dehydratase